MKSIIVKAFLLDVFFGGEWVWGSLLYRGLKKLRKVDREESKFQRDHFLKKRKSLYVMT